MDRLGTAVTVPSAKLSFFLYGCGIVSFFRTRLLCSGQIDSLIDTRWEKNANQIGVAYDVKVHSHVPRRPSSR